MREGFRRDNCKLRLVPFATRVWTRTCLTGVLACLIGIASVGCHDATRAGNTSMNTGNAGADVSQAIPAPRHATMTPYTLLRFHSDLSAWVGQQPGFKSGVVLQEGQKVYVGALPTDDTLAANGIMGVNTQERIREQMMHALPGVRAVLITSDAKAIALLRGWTEFIQSGGDMHRVMPRFHENVQRIWPNGKGVAPNQPSATPNMNTPGAPGSRQTPIGVHVPPIAATGSSAGW